jgi:PTH1 family peptidyl-tRNA hydrolase
MWLLVGLGNPGKEYENTRHNIGFKAVDEIIHRFSFSGAQKKFHGQLHSGMIGNEKTLALKPSTFMNHSGVSVMEAVNFYKIPLENVIVFQDELDLVVGKVRIKTGGGAGGHNGIKDIDARIGKNYHRVRIGIDHPGQAHQVSGYVLKPFSKEDIATIEPLTWRISEHAELLLQGNFSLFMSRTMEEKS